MRALFRGWASCALLSVVTSGWAQNSMPAAPAAPAAASLQEVVVSGSDSDGGVDMRPASRLSGTELLLQSGSTVGETLANMPGVSNSYFGPNAGRPSVRAMEGDRLKVLSNGTDATDLSGLSYDHAMPQDPLTLEGIELLRGPAALLYGGGSAVGGMVNLVDNRIPKNAMSEQGAALGRFDVGVATGNQERSGAGLVEAGNERWVWHVDGFKRNSSDVAVPLTLACSRAGAPASARALCNSANAAQGGAVGVSTFWDHGRLGASVTHYQSLYGTVAEDNVSIDMRNTRYALDAEWRRPNGFWDRLQAQASRTEYQHQELDSGAAKTRFVSPSNSIRLLARHQGWQGWVGQWGVQSDASRFEVNGSEAYLPYSDTQRQALLAHEELAQAWGAWTLGLRAERVSVACTGGSDNPLCAAGPVQRVHNPLNVAGGMHLNLDAQWSWTTHVARTERAPAHNELFAKGVHVATNAYELGNADLGVERALQWDGGLAWKNGSDKAQINLFVNRFDNYIGLFGTGRTLDDAGAPEVGGKPELQYRAVRAQFQGLELQRQGRVTSNSAAWDWRLQADWVRAYNLDTSEALPRIAPLRLAASLQRQAGPWTAGMGLDHATAQDTVATGDRPTGSYSLVNTRLTYRTVQGSQEWLWYARINNLTDALAYPATSVLTTTATDVNGLQKAPLPGRTLKLGLQLSF